MEDQLISFETAKLAKEKGFDIPFHGYYNESGKHFHDSLPSNYNIGKHSVNWYNAPTQPLLQKWLREVYKIYIVVFTDNKCWRFNITNYNIVGVDYSSYEEALEIGLQKALKLIKI